MATARQKTIVVETLTHKEAKRRNIPTAEFESLMRDEEKSPVQIAYARRNRDSALPGSTCTSGPGSPVCG